MRLNVFLAKLLFVEILSLSMGQVLRAGIVLLFQGVQITLQRDHWPQSWLGLLRFLDCTIGTRKSICILASEYDSLSLWLACGIIIIIFLKVTNQRSNFRRSVQNTVTELAQDSFGAKGLQYRPQASTKSKYCVFCCPTDKLILHHTECYIRECFHTLWSKMLETTTFFWSNTSPPKLHWQLHCKKLWTSHSLQPTWMYPRRSSAHSTCPDLRTWDGNRANWRPPCGKSPLWHGNLV